MKFEYLSRLVVIPILFTACFFLSAAPSVSAHGIQPNKISHSSVSSSVTYGCWALSCNGQDPAANNCNLSALHLLSFSVVDTDNNVTLATGNNVYSYGCNSNWGEGTLASYGIALTVRVDTIDSSNTVRFDCFPGVSSTFASDCTGEYSGATGWPAFGNMVDGTNQVEACVNAQSKINGLWYTGCATQ